MSDSIRLKGMPSIIVFKAESRERTIRAFAGQSIILFLMLIVLGGCKARRITEPTPQMDIEPQYWVRILLLDEIDSCTLEIPSAFSIENGDPNRQKKAPSTRLDRIEQAVRVQLVDGQIVITGKTFNYDQIIISPEEPHIFHLNGNGYRGKLRFIISPDGGSFDVINLVPLESYLAGVAGAEMPDYWEPEALKAQVIAARTYCLYIKRRFGSNRSWDVGKTAAHQVYLGLSAESSAIWNAVNETLGMVLTCKNADGTEDIFPAYYSSTCGGHTENSKNVFGDSFEPLTGVPCPYCKDVAKPKFFFWPMIMFDKTEVANRLLQRYKKLQHLGEIREIAVARQSDYEDFSRLTMMELRGSSGEKEFIRAEDFRLAIDSTGGKIKSASFQLLDWDGSWAFLSGRGWGHGVGMCQCGAEGMARQAKTAQQILAHYYPGSKISTIDY